MICFQSVGNFTGNGVRQTLGIIKRHVPLELREVPSGTRVFDWIVPTEWNVREAYVKDSTGRKIIDFQKSNLHLLNYSMPVNARMSLEELKQHLYTLPEHPTGFHIEPLTTKKTGDFASLIINYWRSGTGNMKCLSIQL